MALKKQKLALFLALPALLFSLNAAANCDTNPYGIDCMEKIFAGEITELLPAKDISGIAGTWRPMVFTPIAGKTPAFETIPSPENPNSSLGVANTSDGSRISAMVIGTSGGDNYGQWMNWRSKRQAIMMHPQSFKVRDANTYEFKMAGPNNEQGFQCRQYKSNRNVTQMLCRWLEHTGTEYARRGFFGFIR